METADPRVMNEWMARLQDAADPAALPVIAAYLRHPRLSPGPVGSVGLARVGGVRHPAVALLMGLVGQGSSNARQLLYTCMDAAMSPLASLSMDCTRGVASFDPARAAGRLTAHLTVRSSRRLEAAELLVQLGDVRGLPRSLTSSSGRTQSPGLATSWTWTNSGTSWTRGARRAHRAPSVSCASTRRRTSRTIRGSPAAVRLAAANEWRQWWGGVQNTFVLEARETRIESRVQRVAGPQLWVLALTFGGVTSEMSPVADVLLIAMSYEAKP
jgi:hypothetical protein